MTRILAFVSLLALHFALGAYDYEDGDVLEEGSIMRLRAPEVDETITQCFITSSQDKRYQLFPKNDSPGRYYGSQKRCGILIRKIPMSYAGDWTIETITVKGSVKTKITVKMEQAGITRPADNIYSSAGQWATVWLDSDRDDLSACNLTNPQNGIHNLMEGKVDNLTRINGCGVRMLVSKKTQGTWKFTAQFGDSIIKTATFNINMPYERKNIETIQKSWELGRPAKLELYELEARFCQLTRPDGTKLPLIFGSCFYNIPAVSLYHIGIWNVSYAKSEKMELNHAEISVTTIDPNLLEGSLIPGIGNEVHLLCRSGLKKLDFCTFVRPDKRVMNIPAALGNDNYSYYGHGYQERYSPNREYSECGLTIHNLSKEDFGLWICETGIDQTVQAAVINVANTRMAGQLGRIDNPKVFVKRGDGFKILCSARDVLSYCWLTSPNGTEYSVSSAKGDDKTLKYNGKGFSMGECGAIVEKANDTDNGEWTCHLGTVKDAMEIEATVAVKVTDTYLIPVEDTVYAQPKATMSCRTFLDQEATLQYCRWVRPNRHGINEEEASRYEFQRGMHDCSLTILAFEPEDIGEWQCIASLNTASGTEERVTINLKAQDDETKIDHVLPIVIGSGLLIITLIGAFFVAMRLYKKRSAGLIKSSPPPYYPDNYTVPSGTSNGPEPTVKNKDYVCYK